MVPAASDGIPRVPPYSGHASQRLPLPVRGSHPLRPAFPCGSGRFRRLLRRRPFYPASRLDARGLGCSAFARRYSRNHSCSLLLRVLRCFSSPRSPPPRKGGDTGRSRWVAPFGNPGINGHLPLPRDYRGLSRPSSPPGAKASTVRPRSLPRRHPAPTSSLFPRSLSLVHHANDRPPELAGTWRITGSNR